jgi:glycerophosphoryl diester phosphodiesterase
MPAPDWLTARPIAHRGLHDAGAGRIENSPAAAIAAVARGYAIECDVQLAGDGEALVFHDFTLERLTAAAGRVDATPSEALARLELKGSTDRIPTLQAFLDLVGGRTPIVIEVKSRFDGDMRLAKRVAEVIAGSPHPIALKSFDPAIVAAFGELAPERPRGIVAMLDYSYPDYAACTPDQKHAMANLLHFEATRPDFLSWRVRDLPTAAPYLCRKALGLPVMTWTVRSADDRARAAAHADQMVFEGFEP